MSVAQLQATAPQPTPAVAAAVENVGLKARNRALEDVMLEYMCDAETNAPNGTTKKWLRIFSERLGL